MNAIDLVASTHSFADTPPAPDLVSNGHATNIRDDIAALINGGGPRMNVDDLLSRLYEARESLMEAEGLAKELGIGLAIDEATTHVDHLILHVSASRAS